ncbi:MAG TPA: carbonic anhydrase [Thermoanaerobaculia bacterium]|nr:carbonic anhydrase [Thermoanaerobaculia bacterium]
MRRALIILLLAALPLLAQQQPAAPAPAQPPATPPTIGPQQFWAALLQGNQGYVAGKIAYDNLKEERAMFKENQLPPVTVLGCSDSRVPPELVFNQSLGSLFIVRSAGNVVDDFGLASIEYAIAQGYTKLIVVLGHENCGAVKASLGGADPSTPALRQLATRIRTSFVGVPYDSRDPANVKKAIEANTRSSAAYLLAASTLVRDAEATDRIEIVTAYYSLTTGEVKKLD